MQRVITFVGVPSGDCDCFYWEVDEETFTRITESKPSRFDKSSKRGSYRLYPNDILVDSFCPNLPLRVRVSIAGKKKTAKDL